VVALGGGTGLPVVLRGFKELGLIDGPEERERLVGVVTVTDDGGSSGRLRDEFGMIPPGDVRNCLVALSHNEPLMSRLFQARYRSEGALDGHTAGNLILAALAQESDGGFLAAVALAGEVLNIHGTVLPSSLSSARLVALFGDGSRIVGESKIGAAGRAVDRVSLEPGDLEAAPGVIDAIGEADVVVLGPGSLFTSVLPNLLVPEIRQALHSTGAFRLLLVNAMTEQGETNAFGAVEHLLAVRRHLGFDGIDAALLAADRIPQQTLDRYLSEGARPVDSASEDIDSHVPLVFRRDLLEWTPKVRHEPRKTATAILEAYERWLAQGRPRAGHREVAGEGGRS
jgi:uncharacterized cofD-like protein